MKQIHSFATKWLAKFRDEKTQYIELVDHYLADDCKALGFEMDMGRSFSEKYGKHGSAESLQRIIHEVTDIQALGSAIFSQWRYFNHWAYSGEEIMEPGNREWFIIALTRLDELAELQMSQSENT